MRRFLIDKILDLLDVSIAEQQHTLGTKTVSAGSAYFLIIAFNIFRKVVMDHKPHIGLVDTHAECNCSYYNKHIILYKKLLILFPFFIRKTSMIGTH